ncbi:hypothetical protein D1007_36779 [Hordeum vulgare]|nr:hypothetical protein D1007_36779 [Hordeum vulgare]
MRPRRTWRSYGNYSLSRPNLKKFRKGNPEYIGLLHEMFHEVAVDGTSAYVPGPEDDTKANDDDDDAADGSPMSINTRKRGTSSVDFRSTASSPLKKMNMENGKTKGPFLRTLKEITTRMDKEAETSNTILQAIVDQGNEKAKRSEERKDDSTDGDSIDEPSEEESIDEDSSDEEEEDARRNRVLALLQLRRKRLNNIVIP